MADPDYLGFAHQVMTDGTAVRQNAYSFDQAQRANLAKQIAGQRIANGDYAGAAAALGGVGDVQSASALTQQSIGQQALTAANQGDVVGASAIGAQSGDPATYGKVREAAISGAQQRAAGIANLTQFLSKLPSAPGDAQGDANTPRGQALRRLAASGAGAQYGISGEALEAALQGPLDDNHLAQVQSSLRIPFSGSVKKDEQVYQYGQPVAEGYHDPVILHAGPGTSDTLVTKQGAPLASTTPGPQLASPGSVPIGPDGQPIGPQTPFKNEVVTTAPGSGLSVVDPNPGGASASPASAGTSPINGAGGHNGPGPGGSQGAANNPYNLHSPADGGKWNGETNANPNGTANFSDPALADRAFGKVMTAYASRGVSTPQAFVNTYASSSPAPERAAYARAIEAAVGPSFNLADPATQAAIKRVVISQEGNNGQSGHLTTASATGPTGAPTGAIRTLKQPGGYTDGTFNGVHGQYGPDGQFHAVSGEISPVDAARMSSERIQQLRGNPQVQEAQNSITAYKAMTSIAAQNPGGMRAYTLLDTFARAINPGAVARLGTIEAIKESQGIGDELKGKLLALQSKGFLDQRTVQGLLDAVVPIVQAHYGQVEGLNKQNADWAKANGIDPSQVTVDIGPKPSRFLLNGRGNPAAQSAGGAPVRLQGGGQAARSQYAALPSGARYYAPDGTLRVKK